MSRSLWYWSSCAQLWHMRFRLHRHNLELGFVDHAPYLTSKGSVDDWQFSTRIEQHSGILTLDLVNRFRLLKLLSRGVVFLNPRDSPGAGSSSIITADCCINQFGLHLKLRGHELSYYVYERSARTDRWLLDPSLVSKTNAYMHSLERSARTRLHPGKRPNLTSVPPRPETFLVLGRHILLAHQIVSLFQRALTTLMHFFTSSARVNLLVRWMPFTAALLASQSFPASTIILLDRLIMNARFRSFSAIT